MGWALTHDQCLYKKRVSLDTGAQRGGHHVTLEVKIRMTHVQAKDCQKVPGTSRSWKRQGRTFPRAFRGTMALLTLSFLTQSLQNSKRTNPCCLKPRGAWCFVTATPGKDCSVRALVFPGSASWIFPMISLIY